MSDPVAVLLKFAFLAVLYLFLLWVARSALKDLRTPARTRRAEPIRPGAERRRRAGPCWWSSQGGGGLEAGLSFALDGAIDDRARRRVPRSGSTTRLRRAAMLASTSVSGSFYIEDMNSTNGTYVNGQRAALAGAAAADDRSASATPSSGTSSEVP